MERAIQPNSEVYLQKYRILEGLLEKRYDGQKLAGPSVVVEYIRDEDSKPVRVDLDLLRELRNILSHNAGENGAPVAEPSDEMIEKLDRVIAYVKRTRFAADFGTPAEQVLSARLNDDVLSVMRNMRKNGYSHVPVVDGSAIVGIFSVKCVFDHLAENGLESLGSGARIRDLGQQIRLNRREGERYLFVSAETSIVSVRAAFQRYTEKNRRLATVFVTQDGTPEAPLICILTPWDVLSDQSPTEEIDHERGKDQSPQGGHGPV